MGAWRGSAGWRAGLLVLVAAALAGPAARGGVTQYEWNAPVAGNWTDPSRWTPSAVPGGEPTDEVNIGSGSGRGGTAIVDSPVPPIGRFNIGDGGTGTLEIRPGGSLTTTTTLAADAIGLNGHGTLVVSGGSLTLGRRLVVNDGMVAISGGAVTMPDTVNGDLSLGISAVGELSVSGTGRLDVGRDLKVGDGGEGIVTFSGGQINIGRDLLVGGPFGTGRLSVAGGELNVGRRLIIGGPAGVGILDLESATAEVVAGEFEVSADGALNLDLGTTLTAIRATTASLAGELSAAVSASPAVGTVYPLLRVAGDGVHATTFVGKPQGTIFLADAAGDDIPLRINYAANLDGGTIANDVTLSVLRRGDATLDGTVNRADIARLVANWSSGGGFEQGDLDGNGLVGLADLMTLHRNMGGAALAQPVASAAAVPEPGTMAMVLAVVATMAVFAQMQALPKGGGKVSCYGGAGGCSPDRVIVLDRAIARACDRAGTERQVEAVVMGLLE